jgi:hypothetical protein
MFLVLTMMNINILFFLSVMKPSILVVTSVSENTLGPTSIFLNEQALCTSTSADVSLVIKERYVMELELLRDCSIVVSQKPF